MYIYIYIYIYIKIYIYAHTHTYRLLSKFMSVHLYTDTRLTRNFGRSRLGLTRFRLKSQACAFCRFNCLTAAESSVAGRCDQLTLHTVWPYRYPVCLVIQL